MTNFQNYSCQNKTFDFLFDPENNTFRLDKIKTELLVSYNILKFFTFNSH